MFFRKKVRATDFGKQIAFESNKYFQKAMWEGHNMMGPHYVAPGDFDPLHCNFDYAKFGSLWVVGQGVAFARGIEERLRDQLLSGVEDAMKDFTTKFSMQRFNADVRPHIEGRVSAGLSEKNFNRFAAFLAEETWLGEGEVEDIVRSSFAFGFDTNLRAHKFVAQNVALTF